MRHLTKDRRQPGGDRQNLGARIILGVHIINVTMQEGDGDSIARRSRGVSQETQVIHRTAGDGQDGRSRCGIRPTGKLGRDHRGKGARSTCVIRPRAGDDRIQSGPISQTGGIVDRVIIDLRQDGQGGGRPQVHLDQQYLGPFKIPGSRRITGHRAVILDPDQDTIANRATCPGGEDQVISGTWGNDLGQGRRQVSSAGSESRQCRRLQSYRGGGRPIPTDPDFLEPAVQSRQIIITQIQDSGVAARRDAQLDRDHRGCRPQVDGAGVDTRTRHRSGPTRKSDLVRRQDDVTAVGHRDTGVEEDVDRREVDAVGRHRRLIGRRAGAQDLADASGHGRHSGMQHRMSSRNCQVACSIYCPLEGHRSVRGIGRNLQGWPRRGRRHAPLENDVRGAGDINGPGSQVATRGIQMHQPGRFDDTQGAGDVDRTGDGHRTGRDDGQVIQRHITADRSLDDHVTFTGINRQVLRQGIRQRGAIQITRDEDVIDDATLDYDMATQRTRGDQDTQPRPHPDTVLIQDVSSVRIGVSQQHTGRMSTDETLERSLGQTKNTGHMDAARSYR